MPYRGSMIHSFEIPRNELKTFKQFVERRFPKMFLSNAKIIKSSTVAFVKSIIIIGKANMNLKSK
jgi:hypothetical protein